MDIKADMIGEIFEQTFHSPGYLTDASVYIVQYCGDDLCFHNIEYCDSEGNWMSTNVHGGKYINGDDRYTIVSHGFKQHWNSKI